MRIRYPFAGAFVALILLSTYLTLSSMQIPQVNPQALHLITLFLLTVTFYWILDTTRRRTLHLTLLIVTAILGVGSEALKIFVTEHPFDLPNIAANVLGSLLGVGLCTFYHNRMLERKRKARYGLVPQDDGHEIEDLEMGPQQENGVTGGGDEGGESTDGEGRLTPSSGGDGDIGTVK